MQASKATVPLWCKDYGGRCVIQADIKAGTQVVGTFSFRVPLDNDNDDIADRWEMEKVKEWNTQFGSTVAVNNAYFSAGDDVELTDPDGARTDAARLTFSRSVPNAVLPAIPVTNNAVTMGPIAGNPITHAGEHAQGGDRRTVLDEYRGFILDGGGFDSSGQQKFNAFGIVPQGTTGAVAFAGGHVRLSPAFKEFLVAVDAMTGVANMPTQVGIQGWMNTISQNMSKRQDGAGCRMFYVLHDLATPFFDFLGANDNDNAYIAIMQSYLSDRTDPAKTPSYRPLTTFKHLQLSGRFDQMLTAGVGFDDLGAIFSIDRMKEIASGYMINEDVYAKGYIAHELHHTIVTQAGSDAGEHFNDTSGNGTGGEADDKDRVLWNYNFNYQSQATTLALPIAAGATGPVSITLTTTANLTTQGRLTIGMAPANTPIIASYTGVSGNQLTGCMKLDLTTSPPTSSPLTAFPAGTAVEPRKSGEDNKLIKFGSGTTQYIYRFTPSG